MGKNKTPLLANFILSDAELKTLYADKISSLSGRVGQWYFEVEGPDYVIEKAHDIITLMNEYKQKTQKFQVIEAKPKTKDNDDEGETND